MLAFLSARYVFFDAIHRLVQSRPRAAGSRPAGPRCAADRRVLDAVSLRIEPGQTVAFVGGTGSGKSTLISLLPRLHEPPPGTVTIGGIDIREIPLDRLRAVDQHELAGSLKRAVGGGKPRIELGIRRRMRTPAAGIGGNVSPGGIVEGRIGDHEIGGGRERGRAFAARDLADVGDDDLGPPLVAVSDRVRARERGELGIDLDQRHPQRGRGRRPARGPAPACARDG